MRVLSVDLGTSNTVAVLSAHGRPPRVVDVDGASMMPSAIFLAEDGAIVVGREAERRARLDPSRFEPNPKRRIDEGTLLLGTDVVPVTDALAAVLRRVAEETSRQLGGAKPDEIRLTHPAQWGPVRRNVLLSAARQAGMSTRLVLVPEPVAAAAHFASFPGQSLAPGQALAVYDLGAGTFDVAVVGANQKGFTVLAEAGLPDLGGLDVDQALLEHIGRSVARRDPTRWSHLLRPESTGDRRAQRALREDVKAGKEALSRHPQTEVPLPEPFGDVLVTRLELEQLIRPSLLRSVELLAGTIRSTGLTPDRLAGIYLVGGSSRIPLIATLIAESVRVVPASLDQPETAVAMGAHHVPQEGTSMRTPQGSAPARPTPPRPGAVPVAPPRPRTGPQPVAQQPPPPRTAAPGPAPGPAPRPVPRPAIAPPAPAPVLSAPQPVVAMHGPPPLPPPPPPTRGSSSKPWLIVVGLAVVVAIGVLAVVLVNRNSGGGTASGSGGGGGTTTLSCDDTTTDSSGFTPCMKQFAQTPLDEGASCHKGSAGMSESSDGTIAIVECDFHELTMSYAQFKSTSTMQSQIAGLTKEGGASPPQDWSGGGMDGKYYVLTEGSLSGVLAVVDGQPLAMFVLDTKGDGPDSSGGSLETFFNEHVKPR
ncbi:Hsp70 family protein [Labedaea rhizosphaerae]|uniref:Hsp70 protein n=1 Tax=Labedaea rhizosphaerae TaxID=598644 RepID=A0A4R6S832_LABRH|nr:Hsp70 family protein [Labedaea rhizosphaerae]TDP96022.1 Hsp70 protein [Labedaea rhizosphaerae]